MGLPISGILQIITLVTGMQTADIQSLEIREVPASKLHLLCKEASSDLGACYRTMGGKPWIFLRDDFDQHRASDIAILAHEMTHHVQRENGFFDSAACQRQSETDAYAVQNYILRGAGLPEIPTSDIRSASAC